MNALASCQRCGWTAAGGQADVDRQAERHVKASGHPTMTRLETT